LDLGPQAQLLGSPAVPGILGGHPRGFDLPLAGEAREDRDRNPELGTERFPAEAEREDVVLAPDPGLVLLGEGVFREAVHGRQRRVEPAEDLVRREASLPPRLDLTLRLLE